MDVFNRGSAVRGSAVRTLVIGDWISGLKPVVSWWMVLLARDLVDVSAGGGRPSMDLETVGRWVGDKIDWLMDEEEDWRDPVEPPLRTESPAASSRKRPLDAISRRQGVGQQIVAPVPEPQPTYGEADNSWPDDESFRVERWSRSAAPPSTARRPHSPVSRGPGPSRRPLPRSSRRRD